MYTVDRYHDICAGHRVYGHESKCAHLHGHNYRITFTCVKDSPAPRRFLGAPAAASGLDDLGRVIDFSMIKARLCIWLEENWDHKFLVWEKDPDLTALRAIDRAGVIAVPFNPTAENMAAFLVEYIGPIVLDGTGVRLLSCRVEETRKCAATYTFGGAA
jgi:6-pyruvoyltetrahydropterin/6-carboxytetrahydropterin synthase